MTKVVGSILVGRKQLSKSFIVVSIEPTLLKDAYLYYKSCHRCQQFVKIHKRGMMTLSAINIVEIFDVWRISFMGPFSSSFGNEYILLAVYYVSK